MCLHSGVLGPGLSLVFAGKPQFLPLFKLIPSALSLLLRPAGKFHLGQNGNSIQYSCLENPTDRGAWRAAVQGVTESQTRPKQLCHCRKKSCEQGVYKTGQSEALLLLQQFQAQTGKREKVVLKAVLCGCCCTCT